MKTKIQIRRNRATLRLGGLLTFALLVSMGRGEGVVLKNGTFGNNLSSWEITGRSNAVSVAAFEGRKALMGVKGGQEEPLAIAQSFAAMPGESYELSADVCPVEMKGWCGINLRFYNREGVLISQTPNWQPSLSSGWGQAVVRSRAPAGTVKGTAVLFINGTGTAYWDNPKLTLLAPGSIQDQADVEITVTDELVCADFQGFGYEDDGWFYNQHNAAHGVDEDDAKIREARIEWMNPDMVRMFFWDKEWNPAGDWKTFDWETDDMRSHYRTLDLYQKIGTVINVVGVEWRADDPWPDPKVLSAAVGALLEHLIKTKGYSCIKYWTLTNEPDGFFNESCGDFNKYVQYHIEMKKEIARRGLDVKIVGSDDMITGWFDRCLNAPGYDEVVDMYSTHIYIDKDMIDLADNLFAERVDKLEAKAGVGRGRGKPWTIGEYGFRDHRFNPPYTNPFSEDYLYAMHNQGFVIDGLNRGVASFQYWCIHEMYYVDPTNRMLFGLWNYKDRDWAIRPVYHSMANFCRLTEAGDTVYRCTTTQPDVKAARVGDVLFWVNGSATAKNIQMKGAELKNATIMTEETLAGERECGKTVEKFEGNVLHVPANSFGYAALK